MDLLRRRNRRDKDRTRPSGRTGPSEDNGRPRDRLSGPMPEPPEAPGAERYGGGPVPGREVDERVTTAGGASPARGGLTGTGAGVAGAPPAAEPAERYGRTGRAVGTEGRERHEGAEPGRPGRGERREVVEEVVVTRWSPADAIVSLIGLALALAGIVALVRTGVDRSWFRPVEEVVGANHTALLGVLELGAGVLLILAGVFRQRVLATLLGLAVVAFAAFALVQNDDIQRELAIEDWWSWLLGGLGLLAALMALVRRKGRIERVTKPSEFSDG